MTETTTAPKSAAVPVKVEERRLRLQDPFGLIDELRDELARLWGQRPLMPRPLVRPLARLAETIWAPRMDVFEKNGELVVKAELPGVKKEDLTVEIDEGDLVVGGERKEESEVREEDYYRMERAYGRFHRRLPMPFEVETEQIKASFRDGVLEIRIPKPAGAAPEPKRIAIS